MASHDHKYTAYSNSQVNLLFIANNASPKFQELENDSHANVSFFDTSTTHWASYSGIAKVIEDRSVIKQYWDSWYVLVLYIGHSCSNQTDVISRDSISAYFGDLGDGIHKGDENDPRVVIIEVVPDEVRYWLATSGAISRGVQEVAQAARGKVAVPGELRTITKEEVSSLQVTARRRSRLIFALQIQLIQGLGSK